MRGSDSRLQVLGALAISFSAVGLVGCGSSSGASGSSTTAANSAPASSGASSSPSSTASQQSPTAHPIDVCATLPAAAAAKLSGRPFTKANPRTGLQPLEYGCAYSNEADDVQAEVTVFEHNAAVSYDFFLSGSKNASVVTGVGDKAFFDNDGTMYVLAGSNLIQVNGLKTADQCAALARPILAAH